MLARMVLAARSTGGGYWAAAGGRPPPNPNWTPLRTLVASNVPLVVVPLT
jgi:hypothetical protein